MRVVEDVRRLDNALPGVVLTVGSFDGVHLGHQRILEQVRHHARQRGVTAAVLTMRPHPREFFSPSHAPNLLTSDAKKLALLEEAGMDAVFFLPFNAETARITREEFVEQILVERCGVEHLVVGHDFRFGYQAGGDYAFLTEAAARYGFEVTEAEPVLLEGERVSSTLIREQILQGDLEKAAQLLGRRYAVLGEVVSGRSIGQTIGYPTANIQPYHSAVPAQGVYAAEAHLNGRTHIAAVNIGIAPTIRHAEAAIEAFLLDFDRNIQGEEIELVFHHRLRPERKFPNREALVQQIGRDVEAIRAYFAGESPRGDAAPFS
ncbi:MAG: bifunctional riboflavin kinase/FAD synthetase [Candidatus Hydrogenedentota bacterium]